MGLFIAIWRHKNISINLLSQKDNDKGIETYFKKIKEESWHHFHQIIQVSKIISFQYPKSCWIMFTCGIRTWLQKFIIFYQSLNISYIYYLIHPGEVIDFRLYMPRFNFRFVYILYMTFHPLMYGNCTENL